MKATGLQRAAGDPFLEDFFSRIPRDVAAGFSDEQLLAIRRAFGARMRGAHVVDVRLSLPLPFKRLYIVLLLGSERRTIARRHDDRRDSPLATAGNFVFAVLFFGLLLTALLGILYVVKSALGIDLVPGMSLGLWQALVEQATFMFR
jgi:hypothetical protein